MVIGRPPDCPSCAQMRQWYGPDGNAFRAENEKLCLALARCGEEVEQLQAALDDAGLVINDMRRERADPRRQAADELSRQGQEMGLDEPRCPACAAPIVSLRTCLKCGGPLDAEEADPDAEDGGPDR